ncbi:MAG: hypothetical protein ACJ8LG_06520, partial [Massilia sp.]
MVDFLLWRLISSTFDEVSVLEVQPFEEVELARPQLHGLDHVLGGRDQVDVCAPSLPLVPDAQIVRPGLGDGLQRGRPVRGVADPHA